MGKGGSEFEMITTKIQPVALPIFSMIRLTVRQITMREKAFREP